VSDELSDRHGFEISRHGVPQVMVAAAPLLEVTHSIARACRAES
jgi:hypothetical protein